MTKGTILYHERFQLYNGEIANKLLVILNTPTSEIQEPYVMCKTTSRLDNKPREQGCHLEQSLFFIKASYDQFPKDTWLQFNELYELHIQELLDLHFKKSVKIIGTLREQTINEIINCIKKSDDISDYRLKLITKKVKETR